MTTQNNTNTTANTIKPRFRHYTPTRSASYSGPSLTVAFVTEQNADGSLNVEFGIAQCSKADAFSKSRGAELAVARIVKRAAKLAANKTIVPQLNPYNGRLAPVTAGSITLTREQIEGKSIADIIRDNYLSQRTASMRPWTLAELMQGIDADNEDNGQ